MRVFPPGTGPLLAGLFLAGVPVAAEEIDISQILDLPEADVIVLGDVPDNPSHHLNQATAVAALRPAALVFEMFGPEAALAATPEMRASPVRLEQALGWATDWPDFAMYYPIYVAAPDAAVFGGAVSDDDRRRASRDGAAKVLGPSAPVFGLDKPLDAQERALREARQLEAQCSAVLQEMVSGRVETQRLADAALARAVLAALAETGGPVAVIAGNGRGRTDWGMPRFLTRARPDVTVLSIAQFEEPATDAPHDYWIVTPTVAREDPCQSLTRGD